LPIFPPGEGHPANAQKFGKIIDFNAEILPQKSDFRASQQAGAENNSFPYAIQ
jgi:hypothetical protein